MKSQRAQGIRKGKGPMGMMGMGGDDDILSFRGTMRVGGGNDDFGPELKVVHQDQLDAIQKAFFKDNFNDKE